MFYNEIKPSLQYSNFIKCFWRLEDDSIGPRDTELILPDGSPEIVFNLGDPFLRHYSDRTERQARSIIVGQITGHIRVQPTKTVDLFGVRFQPAGIFPLVRSSINEFTDRIESVETVLGGIGRELEERMFGAQTDEVRIAIFEAFFAKVFENRQNGSLAMRSLAMIAKNRGLVKIEVVARSLNTSWKTLERHFRREVGINPKMFCRITRLQNALQSINKDEGLPWTEIAYSSGYVDQAHFIKDFRDFSGVSPGTYVRQQTSMSDSFVG